MTKDSGDHLVVPIRTKSLTSGTGVFQYIGFVEILVRLKANTSLDQQGQ